MATISNFLTKAIAGVSNALTVAKSSLAKIMTLDVPASGPPVSGAVLWIDGSVLSAGSYDASTTPVTNLGTQGGSFTSGPYAVEAAVINGKNALKFDGVDDYLKSVNAYTNTGTALTMFVVQRRISDKGQYSGSLACVKAGTNNDYDLASNFTYHQVPGGNMGGQRASVDLPSHAHPGNGVTSIGTFKFDNVNCTHYQKTSSSSVSGSVASSGSFDCSQTVVAARWYSSAINSVNNIYVAEVLVYNTALNDTDRLAVESYLATKWGV